MKRRHHRRSGKAQSRGGLVVLLILVVILVVYLGSAGAVGSWMAEQVIAPLVNGWNAINGSPTPTVSAANSAPPSVSLPVSPTPLNPSPSASIVSHTVALPAFQAYALQTGAYQTLTNAEVEAERIQKLGGAGYIVDDSVKRVLAKAYKSRADAESVQQKWKLEGQDSLIFVFDVPATSLKVTATEDQLAVVEDAVAQYTGQIEALQVISDKLDKNEISAADAAKQISEVANELEGALRNMEKAFAGSSGEKLCDGLLNLYRKATQGWKTLGQMTNSAELNRSVKEEHLEMIDGYRVWSRSLQP